MLFRNAFGLTVIFLMGSVMAAPIAEAEAGAIAAERSTTSLTEARSSGIIARQDIPAEIAVTSPDGQVRPYKPRELLNRVLPRQDIPVEVAVKAPAGNVQPYA